MPRPIARDPQSGRMFTVDAQTNQWRPLSDDEYGNLRPTGVLDEMGVSGMERFTIKNLAANPAAASAFLKARGYEVLRYGDGLNFAVRKPGERAWKVVDPAKGGVGELFRDLSDLIGDFGVGAATAAGTISGGGVASVATGALAGGAAEAARQGIGALAGIPDNVGAGEIVASGVGGAIAGPVGRALTSGAAAAARGVSRVTAPGGAVSRIGEQIAQRIGGIRPGQNLEVSDILLDRSRSMPKPLWRPIDAVDALQAHMSEVASRHIGRITSVHDDILRGKTVDVSKWEKDLRELSDLWSPSKLLGTVEPNEAALLEAAAARLAPPSKATITTEVLERLGGRIEGEEIKLGAAKAGRSFYETVEKEFAKQMDEWKASLREFPALNAFQVKRVLAERASQMDAMAGAGTAAPGAAGVARKAEFRGLAKWAHRFTEDLHTQSGKQVADLDALLANLQRARNGLRDWIGSDVMAAEKRLAGAFNPGGEEAQRLLRAYDAAFPGLQFTKVFQRFRKGAARPKGALDAARQAAIGQRFTGTPGAPEEFGLPGLVARFTATGVPLGAAAVGGLAGFGAAGPIGGLAGAAIAPFVFSPANLVRVAPFASATNAAISRMATGAEKVAVTDALRTAVNVLGSTAAQATGRRIASQDKKGRRRAIFLGS